MQTPSASNFQGHSGYVERTSKVVPGLRDMHRMAGQLLAERVPEAGRVLVLGAGGGLELRAFAEMQPSWRFDGVDPARGMLDTARETLGPFNSQVDFHEGLIDSAPLGPFDGATCFLTLHFLPEAERIMTVAEIHRRLKPGAPLVIAHHSFPTSDAEKEKWLTRFATYSNAAGTGVMMAQESIAAMKDRLPVLSPADDEAVLHKAGFIDVELFYAALSFRGWVAYRSE